MATQKPGKSIANEEWPIMMVTSKLGVVDNLVCHQIPLPGLNPSFLQLLGVWAANSSQLTPLWELPSTVREPLDLRTLFPAWPAFGDWTTGGKKAPSHPLQDNAEGPCQFQSSPLGLADAFVHTNASQCNFSLCPVLLPSLPHRCWFSLLTSFHAISILESPTQGTAFPQ